MRDRQGEGTSHLSLGKMNFSREQKSWKGQDGKDGPDSELRAKQCPVRGPDPQLGAPFGAEVKPGPASHRAAALG